MMLLSPECPLGSAGLAAGLTRNRELPRLRGVRLIGEHPVHRPPVADWEMEAWREGLGGFV